ncbi:preprotein translocase subunit SecE [Derxia gummosa]|uniref:Protein translocase subunit SecE n=1 Tax=Derxia gummosa DSM 723 TaxID=1121388 RepID=A0A8B6X6X0_9BURK|nr:preprotein translocase subunit SecE [Derxia gummosa]
MTNRSVETVLTAADKVKVALSLIVIASGVIGFYALSAQPMVLRVIVVLAALGAAIAIAWVSEPGKQFLVFAREAYLEARRVTWPTRKETLQMTGVIFAFVVVMALFLWTVDKSLEWLLYDLILGWKR